MTAIFTLQYIAAELTGYKKLPSKKEGNAVILLLFADENIYRMLQFLPITTVMFSNFLSFVLFIGS